MIYLQPSRPLLVLIGPSATGKSTLGRVLQERGIIELTPSWTTRPLRTDEQVLKSEHIFCSEKEFLEKEQAGFFLKTVSLFGLHYRYGLPKVTVPEGSKIPAVILRAPLLDMLKEHYTNAVIYNIESEYSTIQKRLQERKSQGDNTKGRLEAYYAETELGRTWANRTFVNTQFDNLFDAVTTALRVDFPSHPELFQLP